MKCLWCKQGTYAKAADTDSPHWVLERFGVNPVGEARWEVWVSGCCGNVQFLRPDLKVELKAA